MDVRTEKLNQWLQKHFLDTSFTMEPLANDASFRRYFRIVSNGKTFIAMDACPTKEDPASFVKIALWLDEAGLPVPKIKAENLSEGFLLLSDLGNELLLSHLNDKNVDSFYWQGMQTLLTLQKAYSPSSLSLPSFNKDLLQTELDLFPHWFLKGYLKYDPPPSFIKNIFDALIENAVSQPQVFVHRDFHSRNLMIQKDKSLAIIDFQDAVIGPCTYDLVSLLKDCYIKWSFSQLLMH